MFKFAWTSSSANRKVLLSYTALCKLSLEAELKQHIQPTLHSGCYESIECLVIAQGKDIVCTWWLYLHNGS